MAVKKMKSLLDSGFSFIIYVWCIGSLFNMNGSLKALKVERDFPTVK